MAHDLSTYAHFNCTITLSKAATQHQLANWQSMNHTDQAMLALILNHSTEHCVAHLPHRVMEELLGKSNATVRRAIRKLVKLNIIERIHYINPGIQGLGPNVYAIRPYEEPTSFEDK